MLEKLFSRFLAELPAILLNSTGVAILLFAVYWVGWALFRLFRPRAYTPRWGSILIVLATAAALFGFLYLTASNTSRRAFIDLPMYELVRSLINIGVGILIAGGVAWGLNWAARRGSTKKPALYPLIVTGGVLVILGAVAAVLYQLTFKPDLDQVTVDAPAVGEIAIEGNLPISVFENQVVQMPTALTLGAEGELYVASNIGTIWVMVDEDQNGTADKVTEFATGLHQPQGLAWTPQGVYVTQLEKVVRLTDTDGDGQADETTTIVDGLPGEEYAFHQPHGLALGPDGRLYVGVGSTTDHRPESHPLAARIFSVNLDGSDLQTYATGMRNPYSIVPAPGGGFFSIDNGSSGCIDTATQIDDCSNKVDVPEELNYVVEGGDYGFPNHFGVPPEDSGTLPPMETFPDHSAPTGLILYTGQRLPAKYNGQLLMALWARGEIYSVRFFRTSENSFIGSSRLFASGFAGPSALLQAPDGGIYVASFSSNVIHYIGQGSRTRTLGASSGTVTSLVGVEDGAELFRVACANCHGPEAKGIEGVGKNLVESEFVAGLSEDELAAFITTGRKVDDPANTTGVPMPALGGRTDLAPGQVLELARYLKKLQASP
ncbi:MAG: PQQ-dependent sugar dehydrogenase [Anaerolineales bacterium]|nr:PQQ-dependent sugar dehydrogenase [Anaerolineales bacterium]